MGDKSRIEWCDATYNPITGCTPVSAGCQNCYAERMVKRFPHLHNAKVPTTMAVRNADVLFREIQFHPDRLDIPLRWKKPRRIFVCSMGDLFHEDVNLSWINQVLAVVACSPRHTFMILTKRPKRMFEYFTEHLVQEGIIGSSMRFMSDEGVCQVSNSIEGVLGKGHNVGWPMRNLMLGVTAENQEMADQRIPILLQTPAAKRFVSVEPMLGPIDLFRAGMKLDGKLNVATGERAFLHWVICGPENGPGARTMDFAWPRGLLRQARAAGVPFFMKTPHKTVRPEDLVVQQFPEVSR